MHNATIPPNGVYRIIFDPEQRDALCKRYQLT